jgi:hypothetical protein
MLVNNPNYSQRFHKTGLQLLGGDSAIFEAAFSDIANEVNFEYNHFLDNLNTGLRPDLIAWDWKTPARRIASGKPAEVSIVANRGWQASGVAVEAGAVYEITASGHWQLDEQTPPVDADGSGAGRRGQLLGVVMANYQLSDVMGLGTKTTWTAPASGVLYLRCRETMALLADNSGSVSVEVKRVE